MAESRATPLERRGFYVQWPLHENPAERGPEPRHFPRRCASSITTITRRRVVSAVRDPLAAFLDDLRLAGRSDATLRGYRADLSRWIACREAARSDAAAARAYLEGAAPATVARRHSSLAAYWRWLGQQGADPGPCPTLQHERPRVELPPPRAIPEPDLTSIQHAIRGLPPSWRGLFTLILDTALRVGEVTRLHVRDLDWSPGNEHLRVLGKGGRWRVVPLLPAMESRRLLRRLCRDRPGEGFLFPGRTGAITVRAVEWRFAQIQQKVSQEIYRVHDLRHTTAPT